MRIVEIRRKLGSIRYNTLARILVEVPEPSYIAATLVDNHVECCGQPY